MQLDLCDEGEEGSQVYKKTTSNELMHRLESELIEVDRLFKYYAVRRKYLKRSILNLKPAEWQSEDVEYRHRPRVPNNAYKPYKEAHDVIVCKPLKKNTLSNGNQNVQ